MPRFDDYRHDGEPRRPSADLVYAFFRVDWSASRRRGGYFAQDRLADTLIHHRAIDRLLVADAPRLLPAIWRDRIAGRATPLPPAPGVRQHAQPGSVLRRDPTDPRVARQLYRVYGQRLGSRARREGMTRPALLTHNPFLAAYGQLDWCSSVTLYLTDDYVVAPSHQAWRSAYEDAWRTLRERGRAVAAVSRPILDRMDPLGPRLLVPNGIEPAEWQSEGERPAWLRPLPRPWLLYTGGLDDRVDPIALESISREVPGASIILMGLPLDAEHILRLERIAGVVVRPPVARDELAATVSHADVCLVPHRRTPLTEAMSPLKLYEYLAAGRPVAAIDLPPMRGLGDRVVLADSSDAFGVATRQALDLSAIDEAERRAFLATNSWAARHSQLLTFVGRDAV